MDFEESRQLAIRIMEEHRQLLDTFRTACAQLFELQEAAKQKPFLRKPGICLRFRVGPNELATCSPSFNYTRKEVQCWKQVLELIQQEQVERDGKPYFRPIKRLKVSLTEQGTVLMQWYRNRLADDVRLLMAGVEGFLRSPEQQLEGMPHCSICGRKLTDGQSKSRGVGPECIELVSRWPLYSSRSVLPQPLVQLELPLGE
jgi:hypothetical protein